MLVYLIRHGQTQFNADGRVQGWLDVPLNDVGRSQAQRLAQRFTGRPIDIVFTSPLARAAETARALAAPGDLQLIFDDRLREYNMGDWTGKTGDEISAEASELGLDDPLIPIPGGESAMDMRTRVSAFVKDLSLRHSRAFRSVAVVSHGGTLGAILGSMLAMPVLRRHPFTFGNASVSEVSWQADRWRVHTLNDQQHLCE
jgi:probable phosphoglycerate mutase